MLKIEVEYKGHPVTVSLDSSDPNEMADIVVEADVPEMFESWLSEQGGAFGHMIGDATTPIDLHYAIASSGFPFEILEGAELVKKYDPDIPDEAVT